MASCTITRHATERAAQRYGVTAQPADWHRAFLDITDTVLGIRHPALLLSRLGRGRERWLVRVADRVLVVVYAPATATIVTVLYPRAPRVRPRRMTGSARQARLRMCSDD